MKNENDKSETIQEKFDLKSRLIAISAIKLSRKALQEIIEKSRWLDKYIQPSIKALFSEEDRLTGDIVEALENKQITIEDIDRISAY